MKVIIRHTGGKLADIRDFKGYARRCVVHAFCHCADTAHSFFVQGTASKVILNAVYVIYVLYIAFGAAALVRIFKKLTNHTFPAALITVTDSDFSLWGQRSCAHGHYKLVYR